MERHGISADDAHSCLIDERPQFPRELQVPIADPASKVRVELDSSCIMFCDLSRDGEVAESNGDERSANNGGKNRPGKVLPEVIENVAPWNSDVESAMCDLVDARAPWPLRMPLANGDQDQSRFRSLFIGRKNRAPLAGRSRDVELDAASKAGPVVTFLFAT
jgi:hypothetical protein